MDKGPMTKKLYIETVGCQMNLLDSELVVGALHRQGYVLTREPTEPAAVGTGTSSTSITASSAAHRWPISRPLSGR
jgi:tRNA-2-methylthio-N6-dimethylallyladenosine synthase